jgi:alpha-tubulin suppressor-like RCC1 family protein
MIPLFRRLLRLLFVPILLRSPKKLRAICLTIGLIAASANAATSGSVVAWGWNQYGQASVPEGAKSGVVAVAAGEFHTLALKNDGSVVAWGRNNYGQTGVPEGAQSGIVAISAGSYHSVALKSDGSVVVWGSNAHGETNVPAGAKSGVKMIAAGLGHTLALRTDGSVVAWGLSDYFQTLVPDEAKSGVTAVAAGSHHSMAIKLNGSVIAWGDLIHGQTIVPQTASSGVIGIAGGFEHSVALKSDGSIVTWPDRPIVLRAPSWVPRDLVSVCAGYEYSMALSKAGAVYAWGYNSDGQLLVPESAATGVIAITAGLYHSAALVVVTTPPTLRFNRGLDGLQISWPASYSGHSLQGASLLNPPDWQPTPGTPVVLNGTNTLTILPTGTAKFFRLIKP